MVHYGCGHLILCNEGLAIPELLSGSKGVQGMKEKADMHRSVYMRPRKRQ